MISNDDLRMLCIKNSWFTEGTNEQYEKLFVLNLNSPAYMIDTIITIIWFCSEDVSRLDIYNELKPYLDKEVTQ